MSSETVYLCFDASSDDTRIDGLTMARKPFSMPILPVGSLVCPWSGPRDCENLFEINYYCLRGDGSIECWLDTEGAAWTELALLLLHGFELGQHVPETDYFAPLDADMISAIIA